MGLIIFREAIAAKEEFAYQYIKDLFDQLDEDGTQTLCAAELKKLLDSEAFEWTPRDVSELIDLMDSNGDGVVDYAEFEHTVLHYGRIANRAALGQKGIAGLAIKQPSDKRLYPQSAM